MSPKSQETYTLQPSWKQFFVLYVLAVLTIPILAGIIALYYIRKKHKSIKYIISDTDIRAIDTKYEHHVDLVDIRGVELRQSWLQEKLSIGTLVLNTSAAEMELIGIENPGRLKEILEQAIEAETERKEEAEKTKPREPEFEPGDMDKMEYLTGLWQQGLISEEDFEKERKKS